MKAVILAGGLGTRISEESAVRPKPMIEIGGRPILWHIMKSYASHGILEFVICVGYKGYMIKEYFANFVLHNCDVTIDAVRNDIVYHNSQAEPWRVTVVDTGEATATGGRLRRAAAFLGEAGDFCMTYGDGVSNIDIAAVVRHHHASALEATVTAVVPPGRYGALELNGDRVDRFIEKPPGDGAYINGGYFVLSRNVIERIGRDDVAFEGEPLASLARDGQLGAIRHHGFWHPMDTLRDRTHLQALWDSGKAPWRIWT